MTAMMFIGGPLAGQILDLNADLMGLPPMQHCVYVRNQTAPTAPWCEDWLDTPSYSIFTYRREKIGWGAKAAYIYVPKNMDMEDEFFDTLFGDYANAVSELKKARGR